MKIIGTGLQGLLGSRITEVLKEKHQFTNISRSTGVDIADQAQVLHALKSSDAEVVLHLAAKADVDGCEADKLFDLQGKAIHSLSEQAAYFHGKATAWSVNVFGTQNIVAACVETNKKLLYISTDFVFDGERGVYYEDDLPHPLNWYGETKYEGEEVVRKSGLQYAILRIAYPYGVSTASKKDFARAILARLQSGGEVKALTDHIFTPTYIDDIAMAIDTILDKKTEGIFHIVGNQSLTPYDAAVILADTFGFDSKNIGKSSRAEFFAGKAVRPYNLSLKNDKIKQLGVNMRSFEEGVKVLKEGLQ